MGVCVRCHFLQWWDLYRLHQSARSPAVTTLHTGLTGKTSQQVASFSQNITIRLLCAEVFPPLALFPGSIEDRSGGLEWSLGCYIVTLVLATVQYHGKNQADRCLRQAKQNITFSSQV